MGVEIKLSRLDLVSKKGVPVCRVLLLVCFCFCFKKKGSRYVAQADL